MKISCFPGFCPDETDILMITGENRNSYMEAKGKNMKKTRLILLAFTLALTVLAAGCSAKETPAPAADPTVPLVTVPPVVTTAPTEAPAATVSPILPTPAPTAQATSSTES